jgi:hypothetical protein
MIPKKKYRGKKKEKDNMGSYNNRKAKNDDE